MVKIEKSRRRIVFGVCLGVYIIYSHCSWLQPECVRIIQNETQTKVATDETTVANILKKRAMAN